MYPFLLAFAVVPRTLSKLMFDVVNVDALTTWLDTPEPVKVNANDAVADPTTGNKVDLTKSYPFEAPFCELGAIVPTNLVTEPDVWIILIVPVLYPPSCKTRNTVTVAAFLR